MRALLKALLTTGGGAVLAQLFALVANKILAVTLGASGVGFYSLLRQVHDTAVGWGSVGAGGLVQGLAAREGDARRRLQRAGLLLCLAGAGIVAAALWLVPRSVALALFDNDDPGTVLAVTLCGLTALAGVAATFLLNLVNAARAIALLALLSVAGAAATAAMAWPVAMLAQDRLAALALLIGVPLLLQVAVACWALHRLGWSVLAGGAARPGVAEYRYFLGFFGFNVGMGLIASVSLLALRGSIVHAGGLESAGLFAAAWGIGMQSMALVLSSFGAYLLPTLAAATADERRRTLQDAATLVICVSAPLLVALLVLKPLVVTVLFTAEFLPAVDLLQWLLIGNYLKGLSWVLAVPLLANADLRWYFAVEAGWYAVFAPAAILAVREGAGLSGIGIAFVAAYLLYLLVAAMLAARRYGFRLDTRSLAVFVAGAVLVANAAFLTWSRASVDWPLAIGIFVPSLLVAWLGLSPERRGRLLAAVRALPSLGKGKGNAPPPGDGA